MNYLILIDRKFPYKTGESFLENEIGEIAPSFDKVIIYPIDVCVSNAMTRSISAANVDVRVLERRTLNRRKLITLLRAASTISLSKERGIVRKLVDRYFLETSENQFKRIISDLNQIELNNDDTLYIYSYWLYTTAYIAKSLKDYYKSRNITVKAFSRAHRFDIYEEKRKFKFLPQQRVLVETMDSIFPCSDDGTEYLRKKYSYCKEKIKTSYLGTYDHGLGSYSNRKPLKIVSCSRLTKVKRVNMIIDALALLKEMGIEVEWTHIGGGELYNQLKAYSDKLDCVKVHFVGAVPNSEVYDYYQNNDVDLFINVSSSEGLPVSIMEAISFGIPVIATDVGGTCEIVKNGVSGNLLRADFAVQELAELIKSYAQMSDETYGMLRKTTRAYWEEHFQATVNYKDFTEKILNMRLD